MRASGCAIIGFMVGSRWSAGFVVGMAVAALAAAGCTGDDDDDSSTPTAPGSVDEEEGSSSTVELSTVPTRTGTLELDLGGESFELEINVCDLDSEGLEFMAYADERDPPVRVEFSHNQGGRLFVAIDPADILDPGTESWTGEPDFELSSTTAVADEFTMTDLAGESLDATIEVTCPEIG